MWYCRWATNHSTALTDAFATQRPAVWDPNRRVRWNPDLRTYLPWQQDQIPRGLQSILGTIAGEKERERHLRRRGVWHVEDGRETEHRGCAVCYNRFQDYPKGAHSFCRDRLSDRSKGIEENLQFSPFAVGGL